MNPIQNTLPLTLASPTEPIPKDLLTQIFMRVLSHQGVSKICQLSTVCKQWRKMIDTPPFLERIFSHLGWQFPKNCSLSWQTYYHLNMGGYFVQGKPLVKTYQLPEQLDLESKKIVWIKGDDFIAYQRGAKEFILCALGNLDKPVFVQLQHKIFSILALGNLILCGLESGTVSGYSLNEKKMIFETAAHEGAVEHLFPYQEGWVSVCSKKIVFWDANHQPTPLLSDYLPENTCHYDCFCARNSLFFLCSTPNKSERPICYSFDLDSKELLLIPSPIDRANYCTQAWGDEMGVFIKKTIKNKGIISFRRFPFDSRYFFSGESESPSKTLLKIPDNSPTWDFFFRGDVALLLETNFELLPDQEGINEYQSLHVIDLLRKKSDTWEILPPLGKIFAFTENRILSIDSSSRQIRILAFPYDIPTFKR